MVRNGQKADGILGDFFADEMIVSEACENHFDWMGCLGYRSIISPKTRQLQTGSQQREVGARAGGAAERGRHCPLLEVTHLVGAMSLLASLFGAGKSGSAPPGPVSSVARSDGSKRSGGSAAVNAVDLGEMRAKAATDKLRVVNEAIAEHDTYLATLAIYERLITVYRAKKAGLEALAAARGAMRDAVDAVTTPRAGNTETNGANEEKGTGTRYEVSPEELLEQLGPEPKPPAQRSPVNEPRIAADGTEGPPIFLLACAALEGSADALRIVPELLKRGADANARGTRHDHGADVPALCLVVGAMEGAAKIVNNAEAEAEDDR